MAYVIGVGVTKFEKPLTREWDYPDMGRESGKFQVLKNHATVPIWKGLCQSGLSNYSYVAQEQL